MPGNDLPLSQTFFFLRWDNPDTPLTHRQYGSKERGSPSKRSDRGTGRGSLAVVAKDMSVQSASRVPSQSTADDSYMTAKSNFSPHEVEFDTPPDEEVSQMKDGTTASQSPSSSSFQLSHPSHLTPDSQQQQHSQSFQSVQLTPLSSLPSSTASVSSWRSSGSPKMGMRTFMSTSPTHPVSDPDKNNNQQGEEYKHTQAKLTWKDGKNKEDERCTVNELGSKKCYHNPFSGSPNTTNPFLMKSKVVPTMGKL